MTETHCKQILSHLRSGQSITHLQALGKFGCARLAARIYDLKQLGHNISRVMEYDARTDKRFARYSLIKEAN